MSNAHARLRISDWFRQWRSPLRRFLVGKVGVPSADVDDVAQEVFLRLMRYGKSELIENPQAYLYKIAANVAAEWLIRARHRKAQDRMWLAQLIDETQPDSPLLLVQSHAEVKRALQKLTLRQQELLRLFFAEGLTYAEIAKRSGQSLRSVRRQFEKSYDKLRAELDPELLGVMTHGRE